MLSLCYPLKAVTLDSPSVLLRESFNGKIRQKMRKLTRLFPCSLMEPPFFSFVLSKSEGDIVAASPTMCVADGGDACSVVLEGLGRRRIVFTIFCFAVC